MVMVDFESHINGTIPVLVDFYTEWCVPCKLMTPVLQEVKQSVGERATILKMDIEKNPGYAKLYNIQAVPTIAIFKEGQLVWRKGGVTPAHEILQHLQLLLT
jgi:thioredoxin 1